MLPAQEPSLSEPFQQAQRGRNAKPFCMQVPSDDAVQQWRGCMPVQALADQVSMQPFGR
jgi:hypothetical protein